MSYLGASLDTIGLRFGGGFLFGLTHPLRPHAPNAKLSSAFGDPQTITNVSRLACSMRLDPGGVPVSLPQLKGE
jgi:hypothetical protein